MTMGHVLFLECPQCAAKPGPLVVLCDSCIHNRDTIAALEKGLISGGRVSKKSRQRFHFEHGKLAEYAERRAIRLKRTIWAAAFLSSAVTYYLTKAFAG